MPHVPVFVNREQAFYIERSVVVNHSSRDKTKEMSVSDGRCGYLSLILFQEGRDSSIFQLWMLELVEYCQSWPKPN